MPGYWCSPSRAVSPDSRCGARVARQGIRDCARARYPAAGSSEDSARGRTMYQRVLVPLEHSGFDEAILVHVRRLARECGASMVLLHVADGWAARNIHHLKLRE